MISQPIVKGLHLTGDQLAELLVSATDTERDGQAEEFGLVQAQAHLADCSVCAAELSRLREALCVFGQASVAHADRVYSTLPRPIASMLAPQRAYPRALFWVAASTILMAGLLPLEVHWQRAVKSMPAVAAPAAVRSAESDEALLEDVDRELSASVPSPMQALADPTGDSASRQRSLRNHAEGTD